MEKYLLGCDWGTSTFRLQLLDVAKQNVIGEIFSEAGIASMHKLWQKSVEQTEAFTKTAFFRTYLKEQIAALSAKTGTSLEKVTILISGMASSSIGMEDLPYATLPFSVDGSDTVVKRLVSEDGFPHEVLLISGVQSEKDVMRGEETQLLGLLQLLGESGEKLNEGVCIFPGTHSKHIYISDGKVIKFKTFMTGELYNVMSNHSILKDSVQPSQLNTLSDID